METRLMNTRVWPKVLIVFVVGIVLFGGYLTFVPGCMAPAYGGVCRAQKVVAAQQVYSYATYAQPVYLQQVAPAYAYSVGASLQEEAVADRIAALVLEKIEAARPAPVIEQRRSLLSTACARCHTAGSRAVAEQDAPVFFDPVGVLTATREQRASMKTAAKLGAMPPPPTPQLDDDQYIELRRELERVDERQSEPQPPPRGAPPPAPVESGHPQPER